MQNLVDLQLLYPSYTKEPYRLEDKVTIEKLRTANGVYPNVYTTKGFDVTFDVLTRLSQEKTLSETINETATEQVESKFNYAQNPEGGYINKGIYILFYDTDLTVKQAN